MADILVGIIDTYVFRRTEEGLRFLLLKRAQTKKYEHFWQGVAGKIEENETAWEAAVRELKEEIGISSKLDIVGEYPPEKGVNYERTMIYRVLSEGPFVIQKEEVDEVPIARALNS